MSGDPGEGLLRGDPGEALLRGDGPPFREPWEAHAFALAVRLHERGLFTWREWADALAEQIAAAKARGEADRGDTYYQHWLASLESLVAKKGAASLAELQRTAQAWGHAAVRTPHGQPIELEPEDFHP